MTPKKIPTPQRPKKKLVKIYNSIDTVYSSIITKKSYHFLSFLLNISQSSIFFDKHIFVLQGAAYTRPTLNGGKTSQPRFFLENFWTSFYTHPLYIFILYFLDELQYLPKNSLSVSVLCRYEIIRLSRFYFQKNVALVKFHEIKISAKKYHIFLSR